MKFVWGGGGGGIDINLPAGVENDDAGRGASVEEAVDEENAAGVAAAVAKEVEVLAFPASITVVAGCPPSSCC